MRFVFSLIIMHFSCLSFSQTPFEVNVFKEDYQALEEYESVPNLTGLYEIEISAELGFEFPFQDTSATEMLFYPVLGCLSFPDSYHAYAICLFDYLYDYEDFSSMHYGNFERDGLKAWVVEKNFAILGSEQTYGKYMSFQIRLWEDGTIDGVVGPNDLEGSSVYVPGEGFYLDGGPTATLGPAFHMRHPHTGECVTSFDGDVENYQYGCEGGGRLTTIPEAGWVIQFKPIVSNTDDLAKLENSIFPNPCTESITVESAHDLVSVRINDLSGRTIISTHELQINTSDLNAGMYLVELIDKFGNIEVEKLIKQ